MKHKTAIISEIRRKYGIPEGGFVNKEEALQWYKQHFRSTTGEEFTGSFGFTYDLTRRSLEIDYKLTPDGINIAYPTSLDHGVPFDREVSNLVVELEIPEGLAPAARLIVLQGNSLDDGIPNISGWLTVSVGESRLLYSLNKSVSSRRWRDLGSILGLLTSKNGKTFIQGIVQGYEHRRKWGKREQQYRETLLAYQEAIHNRREKGQKGKKGLLKETAKILEKSPEWKIMPDSYTVRRYLDRAEKIWHISTHVGE